MNKEYIKAKLANLPTSPGSYQMKDKNGTIIYVGKAKNLHNRVNSYFTGAHDFKTQKMVSNIEDFDFIVTASEKEALILEINLIKKYRPKYNIQFMDDSSYPYIKLTQEEHPRLLLARDTKKDSKAKYFGPFPDTTHAKETIKLLQSIYPFRRCNQMGSKLCLYYHMGLCLGPCVYPVDKEVYKKMSQEMTRFMNGEVDEVLKDLEEKMFQASEQLEFEKAQGYKEAIEAVKSITQDKQNIEHHAKETMDVFAWCYEKGYMAIHGFLVRNGVTLTKEFRMQPLYGEEEEAFLSFLIQYYDSHPKAKQLVIPSEVSKESADELSEVLETSVFQPQKGYRKQLIDLCKQNAGEQIQLKFDVEEHNESMRLEALQQMKDLIGEPCNRIELFDNSHISGTFTVAACVVYEDGLPQKNEYRLFKLHTQNSDIDSMKEVLYRRYFHLLKENQRFPDAIFLDGGRIQIDAAKEILSSLGLMDTIRLFGLVKDDKHNTRALMNDAYEEYDIDKHSNLFFLLTRMQDEVHRSAISYHRLLRSKAQTKSILDEIEGVGDKRKRLLLKHFGSLKALKEATLEEIAEVVPEQVAKNVYEAIHAQ